MRHMTVARDSFWLGSGRRAGSPDRDTGDEKQGIIRDGLAFLGADIDAPAEADLVVLRLGVGTFGHKLPGTVIERCFLIDLVILPVRPDLYAEGFAHRVFAHHDSSLCAGHVPAAKEVDVALVAHHDVKGPQDIFARAVFALVKQLEDVRADRLDDRVGAFPLVPCSGSDDDVLREDLDASRRTRLAGTAADILLALEQPEHLGIAVLLIPARPFAEVPAVDAAAELGVESNVPGNGPGLTGLLFQQRMVDMDVGAEGTAPVESLAGFAATTLLNGSE